MSFDPVPVDEPATLDAQLALAARLIRDNQAAKLGGILRRQSVRFPNDPRWRLLSALAWYHAVDEGTDVTWTVCCR